MASAAERAGTNCVPDSSGHVWARSQLVNTGVTGTLSNGPAASGSRRRICGIVSGFCHLDGNRGVDCKMGWWLNTRGERRDNPRVRTAVRLESRQISGWPTFMKWKPCMHINAQCGEAGIVVWDYSHCNDEDDEGEVADPEQN